MLRFQKTIQKSYLGDCSIITSSLTLYLNQLLHQTEFWSTSMTRLGYFWKVWVAFFHTKVAQIFADSLGSFKHHNFLIKNACGYFLGLFWNNFGSFLFQNLVTLSRARHTISQGKCFFFFEAAAFKSRLILTVLSRTK